MAKKKLILGLILASFDTKMVTKNFFVSCTSTGCYTLLQAITVCDFKENSWTKLEKMAEKP